MHDDILVVVCDTRMFMAYFYVSFISYATNHDDGNRLCVFFFCVFVFVENVRGALLLLGLLAEEAEVRRRLRWVDDDCCRSSS